MAKGFFRVHLFGGKKKMILIIFRTVSDCNAGAAATDEQRNERSMQRHWIYYVPCRYLSIAGRDVFPTASYSVYLLSPNNNNHV